MTTLAACRISANDARCEAFHDFSFPHTTSHQCDRTDEVCDQTLFPDLKTPAEMGEKTTAGRDDTWATPKEASPGGQNETLTKVKSSVGLKSNVYYYSGVLFNGWSKILCSI